MNVGGIFIWELRLTTAWSPGWVGCRGHRVTASKPSLSLSPSHSQKKRTELESFSEPGMTINCSVLLFKVRKLNLCQLLQLKDHLLAFLPTQLHFDSFYV